jgi:hypothetical protein
MNMLSSKEVANRQVRVGCCCHNIELYTATFGPVASLPVPSSAVCKPVSNSACLSFPSEVLGGLLHATICAVRAEAPGASSAEPDSGKYFSKGASCPKFKLCFLTR